ncbi:MAG: adenosylcobalamin-dependent ribonucleoside-diphosphate reductase [Gammaproteobacteria bacterium]|nr:adenosylcobalamin-dependent ribonucleoside-diphosphate reductase [Gammaproteobacteria bacterium]
MVTILISDSESFLATPISKHVWESRYRWTEGDVIHDRCIEDSWRRVAHAAAALEPADQALWEARFLDILQGFRFLPGGRILAGAGTGRRVTLFNCFVMGVIEDDLEHIFEALKEGALTMQAGGGVGYDYSSLRPQGSTAHSTGRIASGPVSFMHIWDAMCATVMSAGARRGAMIASLRCDHPDIAAFIDAKRDPDRLRHFNLSVQVTDEFMQAVDNNDTWPLVFPADRLAKDSDEETVVRKWPGFEGDVTCRVLARCSARELWQRLMQASYDTAEPGVLFVDRINQFNNLAYREFITTTNPCGEIPLPPYGACNLGSVNLTQFVRDPFTGSARLDLDAISHTVGIAVRLLDNVIDSSAYPLRQQASQARHSRRLGIGITGLADALIMLGQHYGQAEAREIATRAMQTICHSAYRCSIELAREKGHFPYFEPGAYLNGRFIRSLPEDIRSGISAHGLRNSHLTAIAPTGTISLLANNISSGIEPVFNFHYSRKLRNQGGGYDQFELQDYAFRLWQERNGESAALPNEFVTAQSLSPDTQLAMQAALQPYVDNAISKTVFVPEDFAFTDFQDIYRSAYRQGLKGCTSFRPNPITGEILSLKEGAKDTVEDLSVGCCHINS